MWVCLVFGLIAGLVFGWMAYNRYKEMGEKLRQAEETLAEQRKQIEEVLTQVNKLEKINSELVKREMDYLGRIAGLDKIISDQKKVIEKLESARPETPPGCEEVVAHYLLEIEAWKTNFGLAEKKISEYEGLVLNLRSQIQVKDEEIKLLRARVEQDARVLAGQQEFMKELRRAVKLQNTRAVFQYVGTGVVVGLLVFTLLAK